MEKKINKINVLWFIAVIVYLFIRLIIISNFCYWLVSTSNMNCIFLSLSTPSGLIIFIVYWVLVYKIIKTIKKKNEKAKKILL